MTASEKAKKLGAKSLKQVAEQWDSTTQALHYQFRENPMKFEIIVRGVVSLLSDANQKDNENEKRNSRSVEQSDQHKRNIG